MMCMKAMLTVSIFWVSMSAAPAFAADKEHGKPIFPIAQFAGTPFSTLSNVNNFSMWIRADGWSARNPATGGSGGIFPRGIPAGVIFAEPRGPWPILHKDHDVIPYPSDTSVYTSVHCRQVHSNLSPPARLASARAFTRPWYLYPPRSKTTWSIPLARARSANKVPTAPEADALGFATPAPASRLEAATRVWPWVSSITWA